MALTLTQLSFLIPKTQRGPIDVMDHLAQRLEGRCRGRQLDTAAQLVVAFL